MLPTVHYNMGGIPCNVHGEVRGAPRRRPGLGGARPDGGRRGGLRFGARRQPAGLELAARPRRVRPRRGASLRPRRSSPARRTGRCRRTPASSRPAGSTACATRKGERRTAEIRLDMQRVMQNHAAVFRTGESLSEGVAEARRGVRRPSRTCRSSDRSLVWNTDLVETLELDNLLGQARRHDALARKTARRAAARTRARTIKDRDDASG